MSDWGATLHLSVQQRLTLALTLTFTHFHIVATTHLLNSTWRQVLHSLFPISILEFFTAGSLAAVTIVFSLFFRLQLLDLLHATQCNAAASFFSFIVASNPFCQSQVAFELHPEWKSKMEILCLSNCNKRKTKAEKIPARGLANFTISGWVGVFNPYLCDFFFIELTAFLLIILAET